MTGPQYFELSEESLDGYGGMPWADPLYPANIERGVDTEFARWDNYRGGLWCKACGREVFANFAKGPGTAEIVKGKCWSDVLGGGGNPYGGIFAISERAVDSLRKAECTGFQPFPVEITKIKPKKLLSLPIPNFYWLRITGKAEYDLSETKGQVTRLCPFCHAIRRPVVGGDYRLKIDEATWDGSDFMRVTGTTATICTRRVLEVARENRWTNARFVPVDAPHRNREWHSRWCIDYLGDQWPPREWYPPLPSHGRTLDGWIDYLRLSTGGNVREALIDFGPIAIGRVRELLRDDNEQVRANAAEVLSYIEKRTGWTVGSSVE